ncbi:MAG: hypothetical protein M3299_17290 [Thermoproteota archaeon]|nr:hypothetical protein [Thermoproteota archaeon]
MASENRFHGNRLRTCVLVPLLQIDSFRKGNGYFSYCRKIPHHEVIPPGKVIIQAIFTYDHCGRTLHYYLSEVGF